MKREEVLKIWKEFKEKSEALRTALSEVNSCDAEWVGEQYKKWYEHNFYPKNKSKIDAISALTKKK